MRGRILVIGSGGREHALAWKLSQSPLVGQVFVAPGSDGIATMARCLAADDVPSWIAAAREHEVDLVVIGPELPLVQGAADALREAGFAVFGPGAVAAQLEGDKAFAKEFLVEAGIPTARAAVFDAVGEAHAFLDEHPGAWVVKATGLAAGKGVIVCDDTASAKAAVDMVLGERAFGAAGERILLEERLIGRELSIFAVVSDADYAWFAPSRDHKRLLDGDLGPNTGGMGAYTPVADADAAMLARIDREILAPSVRHLVRRQLEFRGLLYVGVMLTPEGPKVLEYNVRFGDPETQVVLPTFAGDLYSLLAGAARGSLPVRGCLPCAGAAVGVVFAAAGYPSRPRHGDAIEGLDRVESNELIFHAGTRREEGRWITQGGRVLAAVAVDANIAQARDTARRLCTRIQFEGAQHRSDIAAQEVGA